MRPWRARDRGQRRAIVEGLTLPSYASMLSLGLLASLVVGDALARRTGLDPVRVVTAMAMLIPAGLAGARGLSVVLHWRFFRARPAEILRLGRGGAVLYGGLLPPVLLSLPLSRWLELPLGAFWDVALPAALAGVIPGRLGCLSSGCCAGRRTRGRFGIRLPNARGVRERRLPNPIYEAALAGSVLLLSIPLLDEPPFPGAVALFAVGGYSAGRFFLEWMREDRGPRLAGLGALQWMSLALFAPAALGLAAGWLAAGEPTSLAGASAGEDGGSAGFAHLVACGILLVPVVRLFRFVGCSCIVDGHPSHSLTLGVLAPDVGGTGPFLVTMRFFSEPGMTEIEESPVDLPFTVFNAGRLAFEAEVELPEGRYTARCTVERAGAITRIGQCGGELNAPGLAVRFAAEASDPPEELDVRECFDPLPSP